MYEYGSTWKKKSSTGVSFRSLISQVMFRYCEMIRQSLDLVNVLFLQNLCLGTKFIYPNCDFLGCASGHGVKAQNWDSEILGLPFVQLLTLCMTWAGSLPISDFCFSNCEKRDEIYTSFFFLVAPLEREKWSQVYRTVFLLRLPADMWHVCRLTEETFSWNPKPFYLPVIVIQGPDLFLHQPVASLRDTWDGRERRQEGEKHNPKNKSIQERMRKGIADGSKMHVKFTSKFAVSNYKT